MRKKKRKRVTRPIVVGHLEKISSGAGRDDSGDEGAVFVGDV